MANRRLLDPNQQVSTRRTASHACLQFKTFLLSLALVSCLISIKCASFGHRSTAQQLHHQPEYHLYSKNELDNEPISFEEFIGQSLAQRDTGQYATDNSQSMIIDEPLSRYHNPPQSSRYSSPSELDLLYRQLSRPLKDDQISNFQLSPFGSSSADSAREGEETFVGKFDEPSYDTRRLIDLLRIKEGKQDESVLADQPIAYEFSPKIVTDSKASFFSPAQDQSYVIGAKNAPGQVDDDDNSPLTDNGEHEINSYKVSEDKLSPSFDEGLPISASSLGKRTEETIKSTTLLEDEDEQGKESTGKEATSANNTTSQLGTTEGTTYGTILKSATDDSASKQDESTGPPSTSVFSRMYKNLAKYMPFLKQINILNGNSNDREPSAEIETAKRIGEKRVVSSGDKEEGIEEAKSANTNPRVSKPKLDGGKSTVGTSNSRSNDSRISEANNEDNVKYNDNEEIKEPLIKTRTEPETMLTTPASSQNLSAKTGLLREDSNSGSAENDTTKQDHPSTKGESYNDVDQIPYDKVASEARRAELGQVGEHRVHLLRQSNLVMPFDPSHDEYMSVSHPSGSLVGKYIYAPDHHYVSNPDGSLQNHNNELYAHRSYLRRLQPDTYNSYSDLRPIYAPHGAMSDGNSLSLIGNKSNDVYFLVMVAAFCAMAMTVVFAAGLFAYRVQQSRKSSSETDYPTYGVVGPNNMNGKCGAASLVGGYFGNIGHGSSSSVSKNGSVKHLPDTHSQSDSGVVASGKSVGKRASNEQSSTGSSRMDFMANQNAARMYHYQHQKQQMIISDRNSNGRHTSASDLDSEDENDDGSYTVYECPGLASAHEMEIKNPLFNDDRTP